MKSEAAGRPLGFLSPDLSSLFLAPQPVLAAPAQAPYPSTVPLWPRPAGDATPWWSERLLLKHFSELTLLRHYTQPGVLVQ